MAVYLEQKWEHVLDYGLENVLDILMDIEKVVKLVNHLADKKEVTMAGRLVG